MTQHSVLGCSQPEQFVETGYCFGQFTVPLLVLFFILHKTMQLDTSQKITTTGEFPSGICPDETCDCHGPVEEKMVSETWGKDHQHDPTELKLLKQSDWYRFPDEADVKTLQSRKSGQGKVDADKAWVTETFTVTDEWVEKLIQFSDLSPTVDAFASPGNNRLPKFWTKKENGFDQDSSKEFLWINPPFSQMESVVQKILLDQAQGILVIPCWTRFLWFTVLQTIAVKWFDVPVDLKLF